MSEIAEHPFLAELPASDFLVTQKLHEIRYKRVETDNDVF